MFDSRGIISVEVGKADPDELALEAIDAGAEDVQTEDGSLEIYTTPSDLDAVRQVLEKKRIPVTSAEVSMVPKTTQQLDPKETSTIMKMIERLEELDDVQRVYSNIEVSEEALAAYSALGDRG
jgi:transcriptional/translational regulatory protein YebC/TACO1